MQTNELGVIISSDRDRIGCDYLVKCRSKEAVAWAAKSLPGNRKPYVSNVAKKLLVEIPNDLPDPQKVLTIEEVRELFDFKTKTRREDLKKPL